jgi:hypothetical protein
MKRIEKEKEREEYRECKEHDRDEEFSKQYRGIDLNPMQSQKCKSARRVD